jgi:hypothetical protein
MSITSPDRIEILHLGNDMHGFISRASLFVSIRRKAANFAIPISTPHFNLKKTYVAHQVKFLIALETLVGDGGTAHNPALTSFIRLPP